MLPCLLAAMGLAPLHDAKGNLVRNERGYGFTYDFENRLTRVFEDNAPSNGSFDSGEAVFAEYVVDPMGRRIQATTASAAGTFNTSYRFYDDLSVIAEFDASNAAAPTVVYVHGPTYMDEHVLIRHVSSFGDIFEAYYLLRDLYTVSALVDADGNYLQSYAYTGYGLPATIDLTTNGGCLPGDLDGDLTIDMADIPQFLTVLLEGPADLHEWCASDLNGDGLRDGEDVQPFVNCLLNAACAPAQASIANPFFFTGQRLDRFDAGDLLLYDYKARVFDPKHGRFQQRDPREFTDSYGLYEFVSSRPTLFTDPTGSEFSLAGISISQAIRTGLHALNTYGNATTALKLAKALKAGVGVQQVLAGIIIEMAMDRLGGKALDGVLAAYNKMASGFSKSLYKYATWNKHHLIPQFLDGVAKGKLFNLPKSLYKQFHKDLRKSLKNHDIDLPENAGADEWRYLFETDSAAFNNAKKALLETTAAFDQKHGTNMLAELVEEMQNQNWW